MTVSDLEFMNAVCRDSFEAYAQRVFRIIEPGTHLEYNWTIGCIAEHLEASFRGELPKLIINIAPRFLKSVLVAQAYPSWVMGKEAHHQFIGASYAHSLAERNVMRCRQIMQDEWYMNVFPNTRISKDQNAKDYFTTTQAGQYKGTGIGGSVTGFGCNTLLVDDPISPQEGNSNTVRENANSEIRSTLFSRFNDSRNIRFIMIMQRVHQNDPTGNLMQDDGYYLLKLPAEAKTPIHYSLGGKSWNMEPGELLDPVRTPKIVLEEKRQQLLDYNYVGQYLQDPVPVGGGEIEESWFGFYQAGSIKPKEMNIAILVDASGGEDTNKKKRKLSDWTAMIVIGLANDNNYYVLDMIRDRLNPTERIDTLFMLHRKWNTLSGKSPKVGYEKYGMMTDTHYITQKKKTDAYNFPLIELGGAMSKEDRIRRIIPDAQMGRWYLPASLIYVDGDGRKWDLTQEFLKSEVASFPKSRYDDLLDGTTRIYDADLSMVFPKPKLGMTGKAIKKAMRPKSQGWRDF